GRFPLQMHFSLHPTTNLKKLQALPAASHWINNESVWIYGDIILYTRNYGIIDKVSSEARRSCVLTKNGDLICYMKEKQGFVLDLHASTALLMATDKARLKKKNTLINRCKMKIRFKYGTVNVSLYGEEIEKWRNGIYTVLDGKANAITETVVAPPPVAKKEEPPLKEEEDGEEDINQGDISSLFEYDNTCDLDQSMSRPDSETYTVRQTEHATEQSTKSEVVPHSDLLSDPPTPPKQEHEKEEEPTPTATVQPSFPPHRSANIALIHPHPPRHLLMFIPPTDAPPSKPPRLSLSRIPVAAPPSPAPRRSKPSQSLDPSPLIDRPSIRMVVRAETFKSDISNDSCESRMPYYRGRTQYVERTPKDRRTVTSTASIELTPRSGKKSFTRSPIPLQFYEKEPVEKKPSTEMCAHLDTSVRAYIQQCYEETLKDSKETPPRSSLMENKISFFERANNKDTADFAQRSATMPRKLSRLAVNGPATLPRSATSRTQSTSRVSILDLSFKESAV
ncbi:hypothetical protein PENTCL1PPCAC_10778, partial [Pristionchus entomophagus]